jgi:hypothetical protein
MNHPPAGTEDGPGPFINQGKMRDGENTGLFCERISVLTRLTGSGARAAQDVVRQRHFTDKHSDRDVMKEFMKKR